ncbi:MAG: wax ester/triacylglycerol synthase family O-acyltransferase [Proteobacteria bacterium]|nr:MAG: wax ester/triacylglycerol synthase family O-acyltransferase [Pseudomonadota bacterium]
MKRLSPNDAMFLYGESPETMMHVGSLLPFSPPDNASRHYLRDLLEEVWATTRLEPPWNLKLKSAFLKHPLPAWVEDPSPDIDYHARRSALPWPGGERELGRLVSRLHAVPIDFSRPPWEAHLIEGLKGRRFALYTKMHHSLIDGFTASKMLARSFSTDPAAHTPLFFTLPRPQPERRGGGGAPWARALDGVRAQLDAAREVVDTVRDLAQGLWAGDPQLTEAMIAPHSILNGRIGRNRRFATQQYALEDLKGIAKAAGGTINDVVLALTGASLRRYLQQTGALPERPLIAMLPVNVRPAGDPGGGNAVGAMLVSLATDIEDPVERLEHIIASTRRNKERLSKLSRQAVMQLSALTMAPSGLQTITGTLGRARPQFNVVISNVPGPKVPLYFRGARLEAVYPLSIPIHGQALNITCTSYAGTLDFGFTGCRDSLPSLQNLAVYTGEALARLATAMENRRG